MLPKSELNNNARLTYAGSEESNTKRDSPSDYPLTNSTAKGIYHLFHVHYETLIFQSFSFQS